MYSSIVIVSRKGSNITSQEKWRFIIHKGVVTINLKRKIINKLMETERENIRNLIKFLKMKNFFEKPASINHRLNETGDLMKHVWNVYQILKRKVEKYNLDIPKDSIIIESILHDICKVDRYVKESGKNNTTIKQKKYLRSLYNSADVNTKNKVDLKFDNNGLPIISKSEISELIPWLKNNKDTPCPLDNKEITWGYNDNLEYPLGHGEKSVIMLQKYINLKDREILAIRWHMSAFEEGVIGEKNRDFNSATSKVKDVMLLQLADYEAIFKEKFEIK